MKNLFTINKWLIIITLLLYLTFFYGLLFQVVLGGIQVIMSLFIGYHYKTMNKTTKVLFIKYTICTAVVLLLIVTDNYYDSNMSWNWVIVWIIIPMTLAFLHLYITYLIKKENVQNT